MSCFQIPKMTDKQRIDSLSKFKTIGFLCLLCVFLLPSEVLANGFAFSDHDAKASAMGGAFTAQADKPSAVYYNPAGIVQLEGLQVSANADYAICNVSFDSNGTSAAGGPGKTDAIQGEFLIPSLFSTYKINDQWSAGLGVFSDFGLGVEWPSDWEGRYIAGGTNSQISTMSINPTIAYKPHKKISVALGLVSQYLDFKMENKLPNPSSPFVSSTDLHSKLTGDDWALGYNIGFLYQIIETLKFGASYRSKIKHKSGIEHEITGMPTVTGKADLDLPDILSLGLAWSLEKWTFEFDTEWTGWSTFKNITLDYDNTLPDQSVKQDWGDTWAYRLGGQYKINKSFDIRAGIAFEQNPNPVSTLTPAIPCTDRWVYSLGGGYNSDNWSLDFSYSYKSHADATFNNAVGDYSSIYGAPVGQVTGEFEDSSMHLMAFNFTYRF